VEVADVVIDEREREDFSSLTNWDPGHPYTPGKTRLCGTGYSVLTVESSTTSHSTVRYPGIQLIQGMRTRMARRKTRSKGIAAMVKMPERGRQCTCLL
jgi:hypothetical protein